MASRSCSRWRATTTRATSSPTRAPPPGSAASCATSSPWGRGRSPAWISCASATRRIRGPASGGRRGGRHRRLRQFLRGADGGRLGRLPPPLRRQLPGQRHGGRSRRDRQDFLRQGDRGRKADRLSRLQDRPRRHPRRHHGVGGVRRGFEEKRPTVQVGDPFAEKLLLEACLEIMATDCVIAIQDMGAAGLTCSAVEMGAKGDLGVDARSRSGAVPRGGHERLRDDALGEPGAHAHGAQAREGGARPRRSSANGGSISRWSARPRPACASSCATAAPSWPTCRSRSWATRRRSTTGPHVETPKQPIVQAADVTPPMADRRRARAAHRLARSLQQALGVGAVRPRHPRQHRAAAGRRRRGGAGRWTGRRRWRSPPT